MANVYHHIFPWYNTRVKVDNQVKSLVQSVSVQADMGLDFFTPNNTGQAFVLHNRSKDISIDINYASLGEFRNPTGCDFFDDFGDIYIYTRDTSVDLKCLEIHFSGCLIVGTSSEIGADSIFGTTTEKYRARSYYVKEIPYSIWQDNQPSETGSVFANGSGSGIHPSCYEPLETGQISYTTECTIDREYVYSPGCIRPSFVCIKYPIVTTAKIERMETTTAVSDGGSLSYSGTASGIKGTGDIAFDECSSLPQSQSYAIPSGYLESVEIGGMDIQGRQSVIYNFKSTNDYLPKLKRIIEISG